MTAPMTAPTNERFCVRREGRRQSRRRRSSALGRRAVALSALPLVLVIVVLFLDVAMTRARADAGSSSSSVASAAAFFARSALDDIDSSVAHLRSPSSSPSPWRLMPRGGAASEAADCGTDGAEAGKRRRKSKRKEKARGNDITMTNAATAGNATRDNPPSVSGAGVKKKRRKTTRRRGVDDSDDDAGVRASEERTKASTLESRQKSTGDPADKEGGAADRGHGGDVDESQRRWGTLEVSTARAAEAVGASSRRRRRSSSGSASSPPERLAADGARGSSGQGGGAVAMNRAPAPEGAEHERGGQPKRKTKARRTKRRLSGAKLESDGMTDDLGNAVFMARRTPEDRPAAVAAPAATTMKRDDDDDGARQEGPRRTVKKKKKRKIAGETKQREQSSSATADGPPVAFVTSRRALVSAAGEEVPATILKAAADESAGGRTTKRKVKKRTKRSRDEGVDAEAGTTAIEEPAAQGTNSGERSVESDARDALPDDAAAIAKTSRRKKRRKVKKPPVAEETESRTGAASTGGPPPPSAEEVSRTEAAATALSSRDRIEGRRAERSALRMAALERRAEEGGTDDGMETTTAAVGDISSTPKHVAADGGEALDHSREKEERGATPPGDDEVTAEGAAPIGIGAVVPADDNESADADKDLAESEEGAHGASAGDPKGDATAKSRAEGDKAPKSVAALETSADEDAAPGDDAFSSEVPVQVQQRYAAISMEAAQAVPTHSLSKEGSAPEDERVEAGAAVAESAENAETEDKGVIDSATGALNFTSENSGSSKVQEEEHESSLDSFTVDAKETRDGPKNATDIGFSLGNGVAVNGDRPSEAKPASRKKRKKATKRSEAEIKAAARTGVAAAAARRKSGVSLAAKKDGSKKKRAVGGGKDGECLRRIKREWRDAVRLGIAFDWVRMETVVSKRSSKAVEDQDGDAAEEEERQKYNYVRIGPLGKNLLRWHFSVAGSPNSVYEGGVYHGRVCLPKDYPGSPPRVQMLTPSGRFVPGADICLSASNYHPESWTPRWTILSLIDALRLHMLTTPNEIGGVHAKDERRGELAEQSRTWQRGFVDHTKMVDVGIFSLQGTGEEVDVADVKETGAGVAGNVNSTVYVSSSTCEKAGIAIPYHESQSSASNATARTKKKRSRRKKKRGVSRRTKVKQRDPRPYETDRKLSTMEIVAMSLIRGVIDVLRSRVKRALVIFTIIFTAINSRR